MLREITGNKKLQKHYNIKNNFTEQEFYAFFSREEPEKICNVVNSVLSHIYKRNKKHVKTYLVDTTPVAVDINTVKKYITKDHLKKLDLKWGFSKTKKALYRI